MAYNVSGCRNKHGSNSSLHDKAGGIAGLMETRNERSILTNVRGVTLPERQLRVRHLQSGDELFLVREKGTDSKRHTIALHSVIGKVGHVKDEIAAILLPRMNSGIQYKCVVDSITGVGSTCLGVLIVIEDLSNSSVPLSKEQDVYRSTPNTDRSRHETVDTHAPVDARTLKLGKRRESSEPDNKQIAEDKSDRSRYEDLLHKSQAGFSGAMYQISQDPVFVEKQFHTIQDADRWLKTSAESGYPLACLTMGDRSLKNMEYREALSWYIGAGDSPLSRMRIDAALRKKSAIRKTTDRHVTAKISSTFEGLDVIRQTPMLRPTHAKTEDPPKNRTWSFSESKKYHVLPKRPAKKKAHDAVPADGAQSIQLNQETRPSAPTPSPEEIRMTASMLSAQKKTVLRGPYPCRCQEKAYRYPSSNPLIQGLSGPDNCGIGKVAYQNSTERFKDTDYYGLYTQKYFDMPTRSVFEEINEEDRWVECHFEAMICREECDL
jgi:hypothetical protein